MSASYIFSLIFFFFLIFISLSPSYPTRVAIADDPRPSRTGSLRSSAWATVGQGSPPATLSSRSSADDVAPSCSASRHTSPRPPHRPPFFSPLLRSCTANAFAVRSRSLLLQHVGPLAMGALAAAMLDKGGPCRARAA